ncbi:hypothetical protein U6A24_05530 [Aquimarina gracilis]|uniref:Uncharacterized protein n=1 Tax=Aquimarina gracilis TaxID=874422 RepID=A0ABU5ZS76_9FLAO|nr:hypothetical protein [Aquimarina gracilis]MEB3344910.1 hypothetical protein [Aquimarina gracilis]
MHFIGIVLMDNPDVFYEEDHGRRLFLYERLLIDTSKKLGVKSPKDFDSFKEAEGIADKAPENISDIAWLSKYNEARNSILPKWFLPENAIPDFKKLKKEIENLYNQSNDDEDSEFLIESTEVLIEALQIFRSRNTMFMLCLT